jgi:lipid-A-disaccharide synthase-like uncharacterized protein
MSPPVRAYATCFAIAVVFFLVSTLVSDVIARTTIGSENFGYAISKHAYYASTQPIGTGMLLAPFLLVAWMASSVARRKTMRRGFIFLCVTCSVLTLMYFLAYQESQQYMTQRMWTAATLAVGLLAFKSVPVLIVALVTFLIMRRGPRVEP